MSEFPIELDDTDLDRLADFTVGVLDDVDAAEVARLVASDPSWAAAHSALIEADGAVRADLAQAAIEPMPADVVARVEAALAAASSIDSDERVADVVPFAPRQARSAPPARSRRRLFAGMAAAAAAVAAIAGGISAATNYALDGATSDTAGAPGARYEGATTGDGAQPQAPPQQVGGVGVVSTGTNYRLATLGTLAQAGFLQSRAPELSATPKTNTGDSPVPSFATDQAKVALRRLTAPSALDVCLAQVLLAHPGSVVVVDYATYDGAPALIVLVRQQTGSVVVAVGPDCGLAGSDEKAAATA